VLFVFVQVALLGGYVVLIMKLWHTATSPDPDVG
jgi:hypothetical protein